MSPATQTRELAARDNDGVQVQLLWHPAEHAVTVSVEDARFGKRVGAIEKRLPQHPDLPRVEAVETAHRRDPIRDPILAMLRHGHGCKRRADI